MRISFVQIGAINGFLAVALGAFGAHTLKDRLSAEMLAVWKTGTEYHLSHALALILVALLLAQRESDSKAHRLLRLSGILFAVGIVIFSGSLYALSLSSVRVLGAITPLGGVCFLAGWAALALAGARRGE